MFAKVLAVFALVVAVVGAAARPSGGAGPTRTYVVKPADTLWSIAAATYPGGPREGVWKLEHRNHLTSPTVVPGQRLVVP